MLKYKRILLIVLMLVVREISVKFDDGYSWADMPLTPEEELAVMSTAAQKAGKQ